MQSLWTWLRGVLATPQLADRAQAEAGTTLHRILLGGTAVALLFLIATPWLSTEPARDLAGYLVMFIGHVFALWRLRRGRVRPVAIGVTCFMFAVITANALRAGGLGGVGIFVYPTVVVFAAVTWSTGAATVVAILSSLSALVMGLTQPGGIPAVEVDPAPMRAWLILSAVVAIVCVMLHLAVRSIRDAEHRERLLTEQLRQAQKHEALGRLAGSVAHDFNNMLTVILGNLSLLHGSSDEDRRVIDQIEHAASRSVDMTRELLAFGRRQRVDTERVVTTVAMNACLKLARTLLPETIQLRQAIADNTGDIRLTPAHLERIVVNLVTNARDAMPDGGVLTVSLDPCAVHTGDEYQLRGAKPGSYVRVCVADTGVGLSEAEQLCLFEPYYTTKVTGSGTGLGLASVHSIVTQAGGIIVVESEPGRGTTMQVLLPQAEPTDPSVTGSAT